MGRRNLLLSSHGDPVEHTVFLGGLPLPFSRSDNIGTLAVQCPWNECGAECETSHGMAGAPLCFLKSTSRYTGPFAVQTCTNLFTDKMLDCIGSRVMWPFARCFWGGFAGYVFDAIYTTSERLQNAIPLIGFCGAPLTLLSYMVEGGGSKTWRKAKTFFYENPSTTRKLLAAIADVSVEYLVRQADAGAQVLQVISSSVSASVRGMVSKTSVARLSCLQTCVCFLDCAQAYAILSGTPSTGQQSLRPYTAI